MKARCATLVKDDSLSTDVLYAVMISREIKKWSRRFGFTPFCYAILTAYAVMHVVVSLAPCMIDNRHY